MKKQIFTILMTLYVALGFSQDPTFQKDSEPLEKIAMELTKAYDDKLSLDGKQFTLFQKKAEEFLIREERIHRNFTGKKKLDLINELRKAESLEMRNILTDIQFRRYEQLKPTMQPIGVVKPTKDK